MFSGTEPRREADTSAMFGDSFEVGWESVCVCVCVCLLASQFFVVVCVLCMKQGGPICNIDNSFEDSSLRALINNTLFLSLSLSLLIWRCEGHCIF